MNDKELGKTRKVSIGEESTPVIDNAPLLTHSRAPFRVP